MWEIQIKIYKFAYCLSAIVKKIYGAPEDVKLRIILTLRMSVKSMCVYLILTLWTINAHPLVLAAYPEIFFFWGGGFTPLTELFTVVGCADLWHIWEAGMSWWVHDVLRSLKICQNMMTKILQLLLNAKTSTNCRT